MTETSNTEHQQETNDKKVLQAKMLESYLVSGKTITDFCKSKSEKLPGAATLLGWLENKGYRMTLANSEASEPVVKASVYEALKVENEKLKDKIFAMNIKYRKEELLEAMELIEVSV